VTGVAGIDGGVVRERRDDEGRVARGTGEDGADGALDSVSELSRGLRREARAPGDFA